MSDHHSKSRLPLYISSALVAGLLITYFTVPEVKSFAQEAYQILTSDNEERISNWVGELGVWGPLFIISAMILQMFLIFVPSPLLMVVAILAYGPVWGVLLSIAAIFLASSVGYILGSQLGEVTVNKLIGEKKEKKLEETVENYGFWAVFIFRLAPVLSNDAISFVAGVLRMGYWKFIAATLAGISPLAVLIAYFGENNDRLKSGLLWTSGICLLLFGIYIWFDKKKNRT